MASKKPSRALVTPEFRMSFPHMVDPRAYTEDGAPAGIPAWQVEALFAPDALNTFHIYDEANNKYIDVSFPKLLVELAKEAWGADCDVKALFESQKDKHGDPGKGWPIKNGDLILKRLEARGKKGDHYAGMRCIRFHSASKTKAGQPLNPPMLSIKTADGKFRTLKRDNAEDMVVANNKFQGGNYGFATISVVAQTVSGLRCLTPYLNGIRFTKDGDRIGGVSEMDRFSGFQGGAEAHDPSAGMDQEIAF